MLYVKIHPNKQPMQLLQPLGLVCYLFRSSWGDFKVSGALRGAPTGGRKIGIFQLFSNNLDVVCQNPPQ